MGGCVEWVYWQGGLEGCVEWVYWQGTRPGRREPCKGSIVRGGGAGVVDGIRANRVLIYETWRGGVERRVGSVRVCVKGEDGEVGSMRVESE